MYEQIDGWTYGGESKFALTTVDRPENEKIPIRGFGENQEGGERDKRETDNIDESELIGLNPPGGRRTKKGVY